MYQLPHVQPFTMSDLTMFSLLPQDGSPISTKEMLLRRLQIGPWDVAYPRHIISTVMNRLIRKVQDSKEPFVICKSESPPREEVSYWIEPRAATRRSSSSGVTSSALLR